MEQSEGELLTKKLAQEPAWMRRPFVEKFLKSLPVIILLVFLFLLYGFFLSHKIDLTTADLGRHIKNGELLLSEAADTRGFAESRMHTGAVGSVLERNYYSYTHPDFPVINHHWGSGLLFYGAWRLGGFVGVHLFFILLSLAAFFFFLLAAKERAGWGIAGLVALLAIPLLGERTEIRPEVFSYLFAGIFFLILSRHRESPGGAVANTYGRTYVLQPENALWFLPVIQILWVNTHIYFLLGPLLVGAFLLESLIQNRAVFFRLLGVFAVVLAATLANPFGYRAVTEAVTFFQNFGYRLAENQSVWFLERLGMVSPNFLIFKIACITLALSYVVVMVRRRSALHLSSLFTAFGIGALALLAVRNFALLGLFLIPLLSENIAALFPSLREHTRSVSAGVWCAGVALVLSVVFVIPRYFPYWRLFGFGLEQGNSAAALFLKEQDIRGPIFNNYDIGGYLIFHLFPKERVFVDNRPEAYPADFFQKVYIPMQEDNEVWEEKFAEYRFNVIIFSYHDATPWGQRFLAARIGDSNWAPVFVDNRVLVLARRTAPNAKLISSFELPKDIFSLVR